MALPPLLDIDELCVSRLVDGRADTPVGDHLSLTVGHGELHALVTENPAAAHVLGSALMGGPHHAVTSGHVRLHGDDITDWAPDVRAKVGLFLARRGPHILPELTPVDLVRAALGASQGRSVSAADARSALSHWATRLDVDPEAALIDHHEVVEMAICEPDIVVVDTNGLEPGDIDQFLSAVRLMQRDRPTIGALFVLTDPSMVDRFDASRVHRLDDATPRGQTDHDATDHDPADDGAAPDQADGAEIAAASEDGR